jgi:hypothetical protein
LEPESIKITINTPDGKTHMIEVKPFDNANTIKDKIAKETGMSVPRQMLELQGKELLDGKTVNDMGNQDGLAVAIEVYKIRITVKTKDGKTLLLDVEPCETIDTIKKVHVLEKKTGLVPKKQCLKLSGGELKNGCSTADEAGTRIEFIWEEAAASFELPALTANFILKEVAASFQLQALTANQVLAAVLRMRGGAGTKSFELPASTVDKVPIVPVPAGAST